MLNFMNITDKNKIADIEHKIEQMAAQIVDSIVIDDNNLEPVDSEGYSMEGAVMHEGQRFYIYLSAYNEDSYELQAARCVAEAIITKDPMLTLVQ